MRRIRIADWIFVLVWLAALAPAIVYLRDLQWPCDVDGLRDLASAQRIADGHWRGDPMYAGEAAWYTPLVPAAIALTSGVGRVTIPRAYVLTGLWLNGLVPLAFFLCARKLLGSTAALAATVMFLFLPPHPEMWTAGTYSPWVFPAISAQLPFFLALLVWTRALETPTPVRLITSGALLALTFLAHAAPAFVLAGIVTLSTLATVVRPLAGVRASVRAAGLLAVAGTSVVFALPFLLPLWTRYRLHVINRAPATWSDPAASPTALVHVAFSQSAIPHWILAAAGLWWISRPVSAAARRVLLAWPVAAAAGYTVTVLSETRAAVPAIVPAYHFTYLFRSFEATLTGCGIVAIAEAATLLLTRSRIRIPSPAVAIVAALGVAASLYPQYLRREGFERAHNFSAAAEKLPELEVYRWIRAHVGPGAVFVASERDALGIVGPAGDSAISVDQLFANPYVDPAIRGGALTRMRAALTAGDWQQFEPDRIRFHVTHVLARDDEAVAMSEHGR
ncbi:MAG TPA: hypothetical protein VL173_18505, partial [Vicinamibacterales bacterium]|nr:hypothetical protein [Vicinamibacterales bacterium]